MTGKSITILIRKKIDGENSIEEIAQKLGVALNVPIISMPYHSTTIKGMIKNILSIRSIKSHIVHVISPSESYLLPFLKSRRIVTFHDLGSIVSSRNVLYRILKYLFYILPALLCADFITCVSHTTKKELISIGRRTRNIQVIYNFYDSRLCYLPKVPSDAPFTILHIGTAARKNLTSTIRAVQGMYVHLVIIGKLSNEQKSLLEECQISYQNEFDIPYERIIHHYQHSDIVSFPSSYEGFGIPIIEANAVGRPIFTGDIPVLHEVGGNAAVYVNPNNTEQIRDTIIQLHQNRELYCHLVDQGLQNSLRFSSEKIIEEYRQLYERVTNK